MRDFLNYVVYTIGCCVGLFACIVGALVGAIWGGFIAHALGADHLTIMIVEFITGAVLVYVFVNALCSFGED